MIALPSASEILKGCRAATMAASADDAAYGLIDDAAIVLGDAKIAWVGRAVDLPQSYRALPSQDLGGRLVTPALIDCHTHIVFGGNRAKEFELRLKGASYEEVARAGGGIRRTAYRISNDASAGSHRVVGTVTDQVLSCRHRSGQRGDSKRASEDSPLEAIRASQRGPSNVTAVSLDL